MMFFSVPFVVKCCLLFMAVGRTHAERTFPL